jgi:hypothetical protein
VLCARMTVSTKMRLSCSDPWSRIRWRT